MVKKYSFLSLILASSIISSVYGMDLPPVLNIPEQSTALVPWVDQQALVRDVTLRSQGEKFISFLESDARDYGILVSFIEGMLVPMCSDDDQREDVIRALDYRQFITAANKGIDRLFAFITPHQHDFLQTGISSKMHESFESYLRELERTSSIFPKALMNGSLLEQRLITRRLLLVERAVKLYRNEFDLNQFLLETLDKQLLYRQDLFMAIITPTDVYNYCRLHVDITDNNQKKLAQNMLLINYSGNNAGRSVFWNIVQEHSYQNNRLELIREIYRFVFDRLTWPTVVLKIEEFKARQTNTPEVNACLGQVFAVLFGEYAAHTDALALQQPEPVIPAGLRRTLF